MVIGSRHREALEVRAAEVQEWHENVCIEEWKVRETSFLQGVMFYCCRLRIDQILCFNLSTKASRALQLETFDLCGQDVEDRLDCRLTASVKQQIHHTRRTVLEKLNECRCYHLVPDFDRREHTVPLDELKDSNLLYRAELIWAIILH